jgi:predicted DNA-binding transcriptional regulator YafY
MAITKNPLIRYKILDSCFRNPYKNFTIDLLLEAVNEKLLELTGDEEQCIKLRQLQDDIAFMRSSKGWEIELADLNDGNKKIYRYENTNFSINNAPLNEIEMTAFQSAIQTLSQFEGMPQFEGIQEIVAKLNTDLKLHTNEKPFIGFDINQDLKGINFFSKLYHSVQNKQPLRITYKDFKAEEAYDFVFYPHYLKAYNNRWFLFGLHQATQKPDWNVAIDRIVNIENEDIPFVATTIDWQDYFSDMIGVSKPENADIVTVVLHFYGITGKYIANKSLHETQKQKWLDAHTLEVSIKVYLNYELERLLLGYSDSVKVIAPQNLISKLKERLTAAVGLYS